MGIQGLLLGIKPYCGVAGNVRDFQGQTFAVDTSSWLHRSVYSIADEYVESMERTAGGGTLDAKCVNTSAKYIIQRCRELLDHAGIRRIYLVLDGKRCPLKAGTNEERDRLRQKNLLEARKLRQQRQKHDLMYEKYKACIKISEEFASTVAKRVDKEFSNDKVSLVWSPYEADAQLVQLHLDGRCTAIVTEDSDVLVYSAACQVAVPILYKLDLKTGECDIFSMNWLLSNDIRIRATSDSNREPIASGNLTCEAANSANADVRTGESMSQLETVLRTLGARQSKSPGWGTRLFVQACVLAGCDYAPRRLPGVGLVTAFKYVRDAGFAGSASNLQNVFSNILRSQLPIKSRRAIPDMDSFEELLAQSEAVFYYHPVALASGKVVHLNDASGQLKHSPLLTRFRDDINFLGSLLMTNPNSSTGIIPDDTMPNRSSRFFRKRKRESQKDVAARLHEHPQSVPSVIHVPTENKWHDTESFNSSVTSPTAPPQKKLPAAIHPKVMSVSRMANPYRQQRAPLEREPLRPRSLNDSLQLNGIQQDLDNRDTTTVDENSPVNKRTRDALQAYACRHREVGIRESNRIVTMKLPVRSQDYRARERRAQEFRTDHDHGIRDEKHSLTGSGFDSNKLQKEAILRSPDHHTRWDQKEAAYDTVQEFRIDHSHGVRDSKLSVPGFDSNKLQKQPLLRSPNHHTPWDQTEAAYDTVQEFRIDHNHGVRDSKLSVPGPGFDSNKLQKETLLRSPNHHPPWDQAEATCDTSQEFRIDHDHGVRDSKLSVPGPGFDSNKLQKETLLRSPNPWDRPEAAYDTLQEFRINHDHGVRDSKLSVPGPGFDSNKLQEETLLRSPNHRPPWDRTEAKYDTSHSTPDLESQLTAWQNIMEGVGRTGHSSGQKECLQSDVAAANIFARNFNGSTSDWMHQDSVTTLQSTRRSSERGAFVNNVTESQHKVTRKTAPRREMHFSIGRTPSGATVEAVADNTEIGGVGGAQQPECTLHSFDPPNENAPCGLHRISFEYYDDVHIPDAGNGSVQYHSEPDMSQDLLVDSEDMPAEEQTSAYLDEDQGFLFQEDAGTCRRVTLDSFNNGESQNVAFFDAAQMLPPQSYGDVPLAPHVFHGKTQNESYNFYDISSPLLPNESTDVLYAANETESSSPTVEDLGNMPEPREHTTGTGRPRHRPREKSTIGPAKTFGRQLGETRFVPRFLKSRKRSLLGRNTRKQTQILDHFPRANDSSKYR